MRVLFTSTRGAGHLQPLLPYAQAMVRRGHDVAVAAPESVRETLAKEGLAHHPVDHPGDEVLKPIWARLRGVSSDDANRITIEEIFGGLVAEVALPKMNEIVRSFRPDVVVRESAEFAATVAAATAGVPHVRVSVHGSFVERVFSSPGLRVDALRHAAGLAPDGGASLRAAPTFTAFPAALDDGLDPPDAKRPIRIRAPLAPSTSSTWATHGAGLPFLYVTFGTIAGSTPETHRVYRAALEAVSTLPVRALLTTGPGLPDGELGAVPANVTVEPWVPQADVLPHATAILHHGGSGTMLGALAAGLPMVIAPLFADQPHNARSIDAVGAGIAVLTPDATSLRAAIERVLVEESMRTVARRVAAEMAALPTADDAVDLIAGIAAGRTVPVTSRAR